MKWINPVQMLLGLFEPSSPAPERSPDRAKAKTPRMGGGGAKLEQSSGHDHGWPQGTPDARIEFLPRLRKTWRLIRRQHSWVCQLPTVFRQAPQEVQDDIAAWIRAVVHPSPGSRTRKKQAQIRIFAWLAPLVPDKIPKSQVQGQTCDLDELFAKLNREYFGGQLVAVVRWSPQIGGLSTHRKLQTALGSHHLLTISRAYDGASVPREAVEGVLYHEMCHIAYPPKPGSGSRRRVHFPEFREAERRYAGFSAWREWEAKHMHRELRILRKGLRISRK